MGSKRGSCYLTGCYPTVSYNGKPVIVVGRVKSRETVGEDISALGTQEVTITGKDRRRPLVLGMGGSTTLEAEAGAAVGVTGVLIAYGRLNSIDDPVGPTTGYFYVLNVLESSDLGDPVIRPLLRAMGR